MRFIEKKIIIIPAKILNISEFFRKKFPIKEAVEPKTIKTKENPKVKKTVLITIKFLFSWEFRTNFAPTISNRIKGDR